MHWHATMAALRDLRGELADFRNYTLLIGGVSETVVGPELGAASQAEP